VWIDDSVPWAVRVIDEVTWAVWVNAYAWMTDANAWMTDANAWTTDANAWTTDANAWTTDANAWTTDAPWTATATLIVLMISARFS